MNLNLSQEQELFLDATRRFLDSESPLSLVRQSFDLPGGFSREWWQHATSLGWTMLGVPETLGGILLSDGPNQDLAIIAESIGRAVAPGPFITTVLSLQALISAEQPERFDELINRIVNGKQLVAWAFGEPENTWLTTDFTTRLERDGNSWILNGVKAYVEAGAEADSLLVTAATGEGICQLVLPVDAPGVRVVRCRSLDFVRRFAEIHFEQVAIRDDLLLIRPDRNSAQIDRQLLLALLLQCAETNGAVEHAMEMTMDYMRDRYAFGRAIASYQALKHRLADMALHLHSCMAITDAALAALDQNAADAYQLACIAKNYVGRKSTEIMSDLVQMTGGIALTWEHDLHIFSRRVALNRALYGTPETYGFHLQQMLADVTQVS